MTMRNPKLNKNYDSYDHIYKVDVLRVKWYSDFKDFCINESNLRILYYNLRKSSEVENNPLCSYLLTPKIQMCQWPWMDHKLD